MSITFAGVPLLLEDPGHEFQAWLERSLPLGDLRLFGAEPMARTSTRNLPRGSDLYKVGLPLPNWSAPPRPKINTLWWPTGASRWSVGLFLADEERAKQIVKTVGQSGRGRLVLKEQGPKSPVAIERTMYLLPPRPLPANGKLWLLPLVDKRYFWQFRDAGNLEVTGGTCWDDLVDAIAIQLGISIERKLFSCAYHYPDPVELTRRYENAAVLLDAVAWCIGCRVVLDGDDQVRLLQASESSDRLNKNRGEKNKREGRLLAGGDSPNRQTLAPSQVRVVFPQWKNGEPMADGAGYAVVRDGKTYTKNTQESGTTKTFFDTAHAIFTDYGGSVPVNVSDLTALADRIAADYYAHLEQAYDIAFSGLKAWEPTGYDDQIWYHFGHQFLAEPQSASDGELDSSRLDKGGYACFTRVVSSPYDFGVVELLHQFGESSSSSSSPSLSPSESGSSVSSESQSSSLSESSRSESSLSESESSWSQSVSGSESSESASSRSSSPSESASHPSGSVSGPSESHPSASGSSVSGSSVSKSSGSASQSFSSVSKSSESQSASASASESSESGSASSISGSDKSTAIVPASWSPTGYTALFIAECPEVRFDDIMAVEMDQAEAAFPIDPRFIEVCEPGTIEVCGCAADAPVTVGASVDGDRVRIRVRRSLVLGLWSWVLGLGFVLRPKAKSRRPKTRIVLRLTGIRKGFRGLRFPNRTQRQFEANERFIRSAYPDE